jgi:hypothetical protein
MEGAGKLGAYHERRLEKREPTDDHISKDRGRRNRLSFV